MLTAETIGDLVRETLRDLVKRDEAKAIELVREYRDKVADRVWDSFEAGRIGPVCDDDGKVVAHIIQASPTLADCRSMTVDELLERAERAGLIDMPCSNGETYCNCGAVIDGAAHAADCPMRADEPHVVNG